MHKPVKKVVIVGGGTAGWMTAALLKKIFLHTLEIELVESEEIGRIGVGEATIPPIRDFNAVLGINEADFLRETNATIKLAIKFDHWHKRDSNYFHTFGAIGKTMALCPFHHFWLRANQSGYQTSLWDYDLNFQCATANKYSVLQSGNELLNIPYAYHFDASLYANFLRRFSESLGVKRTEGIVTQVTLNTDFGHIESLQLKSGTWIPGDFFIDCSGQRGLLINEQLNVGFEEWNRWLPCDSAIAIPSGRMEKNPAYTRSIAHEAGWQWSIPLQHRNGNGLVFSSLHYSDDEAFAVLLNNLERPAIGEPNRIRFNTGRRKQPWYKNVVAIGLASGFIEPLESTSIHLIQSAIVRLIKFFPHLNIDEKNIAEYNRQSALEMEQIRDFIILHYHLNKREEKFWKDVRNMAIPDSLTRKIDLFRCNGNIFRENDDLFLESSWLQVMIGQGINPKDYHPLANIPSFNQLKETLDTIKAIKRSPLKEMPLHDNYLLQICSAK